MKKLTRPCMNAGEHRGARSAGLAGRLLAQWAVPILPLVLLAACEDSRDDAGDAAAGTLEGPDVTVNAVVEEVFTVGSVSGDTWDAFGSVRSVHFDAQANLHVFDSQADHVVVVGPDGSLIRTIGGQGEGPGEFDNVVSVIVGRDGSSTVMGFTTIDVLDPSGEFVQRRTMDPRTDGLVSASTALPDGRLVVTAIGRMGEDPQHEEPGRPIHLLALDGTEPQLHYTAWELPEEDDNEITMGGGAESGLRVRFAAGRAFEPRMEVDVLSDGRLALIDSIGYRVKLVGLDGSVTGTIERPIAPLPVDDAIREADRQRYRERNASRRAPNTRMPVQVEREGVEARTFADEVPVLGGIKVDWEDRIWVERRGPTGDDDGPIDIVTPAGDYIGTLPPDGLRTPDAFGPGGLMAYIERDELDVPTVRVARLVALELQG